MLALIFTGGGDKTTEAPPASKGGLVVNLAEAPTLEPTRELRCFVDGQFVGMATLAVCAQRNGLATDALDVGLDATGALAAARLKQDVITFAFFAAITGVGGGTLRDLLLGLPVFWVQDWRYLAVCLFASTALWLVGQRDWRFRALLWLDAVGLAAYGVMGAAKAASYGVTPLICIVMGVLTAGAPAQARLALDTAGYTRTRSAPTRAMMLAPTP